MVQGPTGSGESLNLAVVCGPHWGREELDGGVAHDGYLYQYMERPSVGAWS